MLLKQLQPVLVLVSDRIVDDAETLVLDKHGLFTIEWFTEYVPVGVTVVRPFHKLSGINKDLARFIQSFDRIRCRSIAF